MIHEFFRSRRLSYQSILLKVLAPVMKRFMYYFIGSSFTKGESMMKSGGLMASMNFMLSAVSFWQRSRIFYWTFDLKSYFPNLSYSMVFRAHNMMLCSKKLEVYLCVMALKAYLAFLI